MNTDIKVAMQRTDQVKEIFEPGTLPDLVAALRDFGAPYMGPEDIKACANGTGYFDGAMRLAPVVLRRPGRRNCRWLV